MSVRLGHLLGRFAIILLSVGITTLTAEARLPQWVPAGGHSVSSAANVDDDIAGLGCLDCLWDAPDIVPAQDPSPEFPAPPEKPLPSKNVFIFHAFAFRSPPL